MKQIKITEANAINFPNKEIGKVYKLSVPKTFKRGNSLIFAYDKREDLQLEDGWEDVPIVEVVQPTLEELREQKLQQANEVFDEYRRTLTEASIEGLITGTINTQLVELTNILKQTKERILDALNTLDYNGLEAFSFDTEEAEQLKQAINNFK